MAGPGSGLGSIVGSAPEGAGAYGTYVTANRWHAFESCEIEQNPVYVKGSGLRGGTLVRDANDRVLTHADAAGSIKTPVYYNGLGRFLASLQGTLGTAPTQINSSTAYLQTHGFANGWQQSLSLEQQIPDVAQVIHYWRVLGAKILEGKFECAAGQALMADLAVDAQDRIPFGSGTASTPPTNDPFFAFHQMQVKLGTFGQEAKVDGVIKWSASIKRAKATKRFNAGNVTTNTNKTYAIKDEPVDNGFADIIGTLDTEYLSDVLFDNYYQTETPFSLCVLFSSATLAGGATLLAVPAAPTVTPTGATGAASYFYKLIFSTGTGTVTSTEGSTTTGNATLSSSNYNALSWTWPAGAQSVAIWRGTVTNGENTLVATLTNNVTAYNDIGGGTGGSPVTTNTATIPYWVQFRFPRCYFVKGSDPKVPGPDIVKPSMPFEVWYDETHPPCSIDLVCQDATQ